ncbi:T9SS type A sorting domain-containing protein [Fluviicola sp.]|uniref:T9SS type A sorting domain-containing protein n=1 Tax=Fluviicola sp. TaxID=1917219 RepID=UPI003D2904F9
MKRKITLSILMVFLSIFYGYSQIQFWSDNFEDAGAPSSGARTPSVNFSCGSPASSYFFRSDLAGITLISGSYSSFEGSKFWAGEDIDFGPTCTNGAISPGQQVTWSGINISGKTGLSFKGFFAANSSFATNWEGSSFAANQDYLIVEYSIDGGAWNKAIAFYASATGQSQTLKLETTGDLIGDGADLTYAFAEFTANLIGTGTTLDLRMNAFSNNSSTEELAIDNFRLFETPSCTAPTITANPPNRAICAGSNTTFTSNASGATAFQWQENSGSGFIDIVNGGVYSNATTNTLTITGATAGMSGYLYRCRAMNGVASCFTNTNQATLTVSSVNTSSTSQTNVSCNGGSNGAASVSPTGGIAPYTYSWSPSGGTGSIATGLSAGAYTVTVTDNIGCQGTRNYTITQPPVLNGSTVVTNVACNGGTNGAINLTPSGGTPGYTFSWVSGPTTEDRTGLAAGTYSVTITDANACTRNVTGITVTQPISAVSGTTVVTNVACNSGTNGAINLTPNGGTGPYTFSWVSGPTTEDRTGLAAGSYSVTITDANACTGTVSGITVTQPTAVSGSTTITNTSCNGGTNGTIDLTPTGGTPGYTYSWGGGVTTQDRTSLAAGSYSVTITDANGCTGTVNATVTQPTAVSGTRTVTNVACFGGSTGAINLTPTGGVGPYTFNWASGPTTEDRTSLTAGTYSVTITDANGCTGTVSTTVTQPAAAISGTTVVTNVACFGGNTGAINLTPTGGVGPYTFNWASGPTTEDRTGLTAGTYSVTITDANGCTGTVSPTVTQPASVVSGTTVVTNVSCFGGSNGAINLTPNGGTGPYTFSWVSGPTTEDRTGLAAGTYSVTITDANACTGTVSGITVTQPTAISVTPASQTNVSCFGGSNGAASINTPTGGAGGYTYNWTPGTPTGDGTVSVTGLTATTWTCTVTDANGCVASQNFTVTQPTAISVTAASQTNIACFGGSNGAAAINTPTGGAGGYTYNWTPGNPTGDGTVSVTGLSATTYTVTVTDANGCVASQNFTVTQPTAISVTPASQTNVSCFGGSNGAASINTPTGGAGGYTYNWTPGNPTGDGTVSVTGLSATTYTCTVTDANGCVASQSFTVTQPTTISVTPASQTNVSCFGGSNGAASINTPTGGAGGYTYNWTPGNPTGDGTVSVTGLSATTYTCTVTDANGCVASQSFTVTQPTAISVTAASQTNVACNGGSNGAAAINTPTGGTPGYTYDWTPGTPTGDGTVSVNGLTSGTWTCNVTDANGCVASQSFTVTQPTAISVTPASQTNIACNGGSNGAAAINTPTGGTPGYTYDWTPGTPTGDGTTSITGLAAGTYTVTVTDANGCTANQAFTITEPPVLVITPTSQTNVSCNGGANGSASVFVNGGTPVYTYSWSPSGGTNANASGLSAGTYTVTVTDGNGCQATQSFTITEPTALDASVGSQVDVLCNGGSTGSATVVPTGGTGTYDYSWSPSGGTAATASGLTAGTYTVTVTDDNNCQTTKTFVITQSAALTSSFSQSACNSYTWGTQTHSTSGTYTQTFTASNGCDSIVTLTLSIVSEITNTVTESSCISYTWAQNGMTYNASGLYVDTIPASGGCDSIVTLDLTINSPSSSSSSEVSCGSYTWAQTGMTYTASGVYMDTIPNAAGCDSVITLNLTIGGSSASESVTVCDSYTWPQTGLEYTSSGMYSDTLTDVNGCDSILVLNLTVTGLPVATATNNGDATITASSGSSYQWINCTTNTPIAGATAQTFAATANGTYAVIVTNAAGCSDTSNCVVIGNVGLDENNSSFGVTLTPNPAQNDVKVSFTGVNEAFIIIYDAQGKVVMTMNQVQSGEMLSLEAFERGVYLVNIMTTSGNHTERLIKQ